MAAFNLIAPFSIFKQIAVTSSIFGTLGCIILSLSTDFDTIARKNNGSIGKVVRYRFQQLSAYDSMIMSYKKETKKYL